MDFKKIREIFNEQADVKDGRILMTEDMFVETISTRGKELIGQAIMPADSQGVQNSGLYWWHRCKAAEDFIHKSPCEPDIYEDQIKAYAHWKKLCDIIPEDYKC